MHREVKLKPGSTNCSTEPSETKLYIRMLNVTSSVEDKGGISYRLERDWYIWQSL